jgi:twitching motility protein PilT
VLSTVHTVDAAESINRMLDFFPPHQHQQARAMIAGTLKGVVSQRLIPSADGTGRVAVCEILVMTGRVRDMVMDPTQTGRLHEVIQEGEYYGMQTFDQALLGHVQAGRVSMEEALKASSHPHDFKLLVAAEGRRSTSMDDVAPRNGSHDRESAAVSSNGHGNGQPAPESPSAPPAPATPLAPVEPETDPPPPPPDEPDTPPAAASANTAVSPGSVPPPGVA